MSTSIVALPDLVVADTETESNVLQAETSFGDADLITIIAPSNGTAGVIEVSHDGVTFCELQSMEESSTLGTVKDVATPAAGKARTYVIVAKYFRIVVSAVTEDATYKVFKRVTHSS